jgi:hypothetical protein
MVNALAATLLAIPEVVAMLAPEDPVQAYIDTNPTANSLEDALYQMQPGQLLVVWIETVLQRTDMVWRNCPLMPGLLPTEVVEIARRTDREGVDYQVIVTQTAETGDWPYP